VSWFEEMAESPCASRGKEETRAQGATNEEPLVVSVESLAPSPAAAAPQDISINRDLIPSIPLDQVFSETVGEKLSSLGVHAYASEEIERNVIAQVQEQAEQVSRMDEPSKKLQQDIQELEEALKKPAPKETLKNLKKNLDLKVLLVFEVFFSFRFSISWKNNIYQIEPEKTIATFGRESRISKEKNCRY
jgi:hypothetical protein